MQLDLASPPRVTVLVPAHDAESTVGAALESVLGQTVSSWQIALADDASRDETWSVVAAYAERLGDRMRAVRRERNAGPAATRNSALAAAPRTELIALLDADDRWLPTYLESQLAAFDAAGGDAGHVGAVGCDAFYETPEGAMLGRFSDLHGWSDPITYEGMLDRSDVWIGALVSRAAFDAVGGSFAEDCFGSEDYDLWLRLLEANYRIVPNREALAIYRTNPGSVSANHGRMAKAGITAYRHALDRGTLDAARRRRVRRRMRHYRALAARAAVGAARRDGSVVALARAVARAAAYGGIALVQSPSRWGEWLRDVARRMR